MIKRINLIEKKPFTFTYQRLMQICLCVLLLTGVLVESAVFRSQRLQKNIAALQAELLQLDTQKNELIKQPVKKTITVGEYQELFNVIQNAPRWSSVVASVSQELPPTVWITQFQSSSLLVAVEPVASNKDPKASQSSTQAPAPVQKILKSSLEINGVSSDMRSITEFAARLSRSESMQGVVLSESVRQGYGFMFKIKGDVNYHVR